MATLREQADMLRRLLPSMTTMFGEPVGEAIVSLTPETAAELHALAARLERMAPHHAEIERVVTGR